MCNHTQPAPTGETGNPLTRRRIHFLDEVRGLDILLMVIYHVFYMAGWVFNLSWGRTLFLFFRPVAPFFAGIFVFLCGISCHLSHNNWKRGGMLALIAIGISLVMGLADFLNLLPGQMIWFGILHFLATAILLFTLFRPLLSKIPPLAGLLVCAFLFLITWNLPFHQGSTIGIPGVWEWKIPDSLIAMPALYPLGIGYGVGADYFPLFPWIFCFLCGSFIGVWAEQDRFPQWMYRRRVPFFSFLGKMTLPIYVVHQPLAYVLCWIGVAVAGWITG